MRSRSMIAVDTVTSLFAIEESILMAFSTAHSHVAYGGFAYL